MNLRAMSIRYVRSLNKRNLKYAWVLIGKTRKMVMIGQNTNIAYKLEARLPVPTWEKWSKFIFVRWCTPMDL